MEGSLIEDNTNFILLRLPTNDLEIIRENNFSANSF